jgi:hypothetical protein
LYICILFFMLSDILQHYLLYEESGFIVEHVNNWIIIIIIIIVARGSAPSYMYLYS